MACRYIGLVADSAFAASESLAPALLQRARATTRIEKSTSTFERDLSISTNCGHLRPLVSVLFVGHPVTHLGRCPEFRRLTRSCISSDGHGFGHVRGGTRIRRYRPN